MMASGLASAPVSPFALEMAVFGEKVFGDAALAGLGGLVAQQQALQVAGQQVHLQVHPAPGPVVGHDGLAEGVGDDGQLEFGAVHGVHREADAVHGDRALERDVAGQLDRGAQAELHGAGVIGAGDHFAESVHVAADQVAAEATGGHQRLFQVDPAAGLETAQAGEAQGLATNVGPEAIAGQFHGGEADPVDGDAVAELDVGKVELAGGDVEAHVAALGREGADLAEGFDDSGKHQLRPPRGRARKAVQLDIDELLFR